ncbi:Helix-turn-helix domain-containing protein [Marinomonas polaris DSM 16579]|uniref:Helix-turn-helix domain-containing protein n=1 Tax=Marinomonas polaris DSM 16579 TaxID=1122206 RepID=A0A1M5EYU2_9GAMM|nr:helix-turn-helix domain-containing protein [Marinomonas polaris]SHF84277.1 Helix-turn-helix domain-containing protein [Marinomonas polaris DSM 16579]
MNKPRLLNRKEAAEYLNIKHQTLAVWASNDRYDLPYLKVGSRVFYRQEDLEFFLNSRTIKRG